MVETVTGTAARLGVSVRRVLRGGEIDGGQLHNGMWLVHCDSVARYEVAAWPGPAAGCRVSVGAAVGALGLLG